MVVVMACERIHTYLLVGTGSWLWPMMCNMLLLEKHRAEIVWMGGAKLSQEEKRQRGGDGVRRRDALRYISSLAGKIQPQYRDNFRKLKLKLKLQQQQDLKDRDYCKSWR